MDDRLTPGRAQRRPSFKPFVLRAGALCASVCLASIPLHHGATAARAQDGSPGAAVSSASRSPTLDRLRAAWEAHAATLPPDVAATLRARLQTNLEAIDRRLESSIRRPAGPVAPADAAWMNRLDDAALTRRERIIRSIVDAWGNTLPAPEVVNAQLDAVAPAHAGWLDRAADLASRLWMLQNRLSLGDPLDQPLADGSDTVRTAIVRAQRDELLTDPIVREALEPVLSRLSDVLSIDASGDLGRLVDLAEMREAPGRPVDPVLALAAWRRLGSTRTAGVGWPADADQLRTEARLTRRMRDLAATIPDAAARARLDEEITRESKRRYAQLLSMASDAESMIEALRMADEFRLNRADLPPRMRFNVAVFDLRERVNRPGVTDTEARDAAKSFLNEVRSIRGGVSFLGDAQRVIAPLQLLVDGRAAPAAHARELPPVGPAATDLWVQRVEGDILRFLPKQRSLPELAFVRVDDGSSDTAVYLGQTEVSVAQFARVTAELGRRGELEKRLPLFTADTDARAGVRTWTWTDTGNLPLAPADAWFPPVRGRPIARPDLVTPPHPGPDSPIQQVSPLAAAYVAGLLDCRLPTSGEWLAGLARAGSAGAPNVRDQRVAEWERSQAPGTRVATETTAGVFGVDNPSLALLKPSSVSDPYLFFADVQAGGAEGTLTYMLGNVAEFVVDESGAFAVIGGSALSHVDADPRVPRPIQDQRSIEGFADVGFRLALSVPIARDAGPGLAARIAQLVNPPPVLLPR